MIPRRSIFSLFLSAGALTVATVAAAEESASPIFERDVRPILKAQRFHCHGEEKELKGGLDLRLVKLILAGSESGAVMEP